MHDLGEALVWTGVRGANLPLKDLPTFSGTNPYANRIKGMGCNGARSCRGRAVADPAQGRNPRGEQELRVRPLALLPLPDLRPPAQQPGPRVPSSGAEPSARGGRLAGRGAAPRGADPGWRHPATRSRPLALLGRGDRSSDDRQPARGRRSLALLRLDARLRRETAQMEAAPPAAHPA